MEELRSWCEVPSIAHFCSLFRAAFDLPDFDIEDLENCLFAFCEDQESPFIIDLICRLLRGCYSRTDIESFNYEVYLKDIFKYRAATEELKDNPFDNSDFKSLDLRTKVEVLHRLCDYRLDAEDVMEQLKGLDGDNMRVSALGSDDSGATYWYFYGNRLYKEDPDPEPVIEEEKPKKKKKKEKDKKEIDKKGKQSKGKKGKKQKKKEEEAPRSRRGRILSKKKKYESSESELSEEEDNQESSGEEYEMPLKQQKSQESTPKGRQSRSTRNSRQTNQHNEEERKEQGTRRSSRKSTSQFTTPVVEKKTRGKTRNSPVNGNISDDDSDDEWNTPLSKTIGKSKTPTPAKDTSRNSGRKRQVSVESSDYGTEEIDDSTKKREKPRKAVKITPDSSVSGDVEYQDVDDIMDDNIKSGRHKSKRGSRVNRRPNYITSSTDSKSNSRRNSLDNTEQDKDENLDVKDKENVNGDAMKVKDEELDSENGCKVKDDDNDIECGSMETMDTRDIEMKDGEKPETNNSNLNEDEGNVNNNHELNSPKKEIKTKNEPEIDSNCVKEENSEKMSNEDDLDITGMDTDKIEIEEKVKDDTQAKPLYINPRWHLICSTVEEWQEVADSLKYSTTKEAKELYKCIVNDFLPEMPAIMEAREKDQKRRQQEMAPRRVSARITMKMKEFQEQERILEEARLLEEKSKREDEEERERQKEIERQEEERKMREERQRSREERQKRLELREYKAQLIAEGKELPPELIYTGNTMNSKYREEDDRSFRCELDKETLDDMEKMLEEVKSHKDSWPFSDPVDEDIAPGYHDIIKKPMDLSTIEKKLSSQTYRTTKRFVSDFNLMINNCYQFSGVDSELGRMATRLKKCIRRCIKIYIDKNDGDSDDEDFHGAVVMQTEKKWRPRRAATSRAIDTLRGAFDDDEFEELTSTPGHEYAASTKKKRLIPELSGDSPHKTPVLNGEKVRKTESVAPRVWQKSSDNTSTETKILTVNGKTFVYKFNNAPNTKKKIVQKLAYNISTTPEKISNKLSEPGDLSTNTPPKNTTLMYQPPSTGALTSSPVRMQSQQTGAILPISSLQTSSMSKVPSVNTPNAPKIIRIMSPSMMNPGNSTNQPVIQTNTPSKAIRISDGMLLLDGKPTGIHISGKTKIIYRGAVSGSSSSTTGQHPIVASSSEVPRANTSGLNVISASSGLISSTGSANSISEQNVIQVAYSGPKRVDSTTGQNNAIAQPVQNSILLANRTSGLPLANQKESIQPLVISGNKTNLTGSIKQIVVGSAQTAIKQPLVVNDGGSRVTSTTSIQPMVINNPNPAIKTILSTQAVRSGGSALKVSCNPSVISKEQINPPSITKAIGNSSTVSMATSLSQTISSSSVVSNVTSTYPPYVTTVNKSEQSNSLNKMILSQNIHQQTESIKHSVKGNMPNISLLSNVQRIVDQSRSLLQSSQKNNESIMGPPLLVPPKRKLSGSPENSSTLPPKLTCLGSPALTKTDCDRLSPPNITFMGASMLNSTENSSSQNVSPCDSDSSLTVIGSSDQFPPYQVSHSSPDKGNLFDILKTNLTESTESASHDSKRTPESSESGLSKGLMDKVSTFAASLHSKTLSGRLNIPAHMLQKSLTKEQQEPLLEDSSATPNTLPLENSTESQDTN